MQKLMAQPADATASDGIDDNFVATTSIRFVADNGMFQPRQVYPDLMGPACFQFDVEQSKAIESLPDAINTERGTPTPHYRHSRAVSRIARNGLIDFAAITFELAVY